ncbi:hypothetical protein EP47_13520 [Legionella norrlandica]|uniref:Uncharacterized protein n=1 Tax=Legionella norrlandica TaxID=1498499 RepID=A0A0A2SNJ4_9GAMM|nr:hypothetical protein [Legionella norrlandica]KGP62720.1 hypothetical protein EP47_13520 [Legionella norrlandica]
MFIQLTSILVLLIGLGGTPIFAKNLTPQPPKGVCVFDIDGTLTEIGSLAAVKTCNALGYGLGINTGENSTSSQVSMNAIYNGVGERAGSLGMLHPDNGEGYFSIIEALYQHYHPNLEYTTIIGNGLNLQPILGNVDLDSSFQYNGGCKNSFNHLCTNWPYKHEGLESIAEYYYPDYVRSQDNYGVKGGQSDIRNECIILFDDQGSTIANYANNIPDTTGNYTLSKTDGEYSQLFRGVHIQQKGWSFASDTEAKETICKTMQSLPVQCQPTSQKMDEICK